MSLNFGISFLLLQHGQGCSFLIGSIIGVIIVIALIAAAIGWLF